MEDLYLMHLLDNQLNQKKLFKSNPQTEKKDTVEKKEKPKEQQP